MPWTGLGLMDHTQRENWQGGVGCTPCTHVCVCVGSDSITDWHAAGMKHVLIKQTFCVLSHSEILSLKPSLRIGVYVWVLVWAEPGTSY